MSHITRQTENESSFLTVKTTVRNVVCVKSYIIFKKVEFWPGDITFWRPLYSGLNVVPLFASNSALVIP